MKLFHRLNGACSGVIQSAHLLGKETGPSSRRGILLSSLVYNVVINVMNGTYLTGFCLTIGADANGINLVVAVLNICNLVQIISPLFLERLSRKKPVLLCLRGTAHVINLAVIPALALIGLPEGMLFPVILVLIGLAQALLAFISPAVQVWHISCIPEDKRLGYFSFFSVVNCMTTYGMLFLCGLAADGLIAAFGDSVALPMLRIAMILLAAGELFFLTKVHEYPAERVLDQGIAGFFKQMFQCIRNCPAYGRIIAVAALWNLVANIPSQYYTTYLLHELKLSYSFLNFVALFNVIVVIVFTPLWRRLISHSSLRNCLFLSVLCYAPHAVGLALTGASTIFLYPVATIYNLIFAAGINLCFSMIPYLNLPEKHRTTYMAFYNTCCALAALSGILLGRILFTILSGLPDVELMGMQFVPAQMLVAFFALALALSAFLFRKLLKGCEVQ